MIKDSGLQPQVSYKIFLKITMIVHLKRYFSITEITLKMKKKCTTSSNNIQEHIRMIGLIHYTKNILRN